MDCAAVCSCVAAVLLGSAGGSAHTTATRIRLAMAAQIIFSSFFIFTASRLFLTGSHRIADGPLHICRNEKNMQYHIIFSHYEMHVLFNPMYEHLNALSHTIH